MLYFSSTIKQEFKLIQFVESKCVFSGSSDALSSAPEPDVSSDSSEMVKAIIQTVQNQDKVLKDLYNHLRCGTSSTAQSFILLEISHLGVHIEKDNFFLSILDD